MGNNITYEPQFAKEIEKDLRTVDKKHILEKRINFLSNVLSVIKSKGYNYEDVKLIEGGACYLDYGNQRHYDLGVCHFFANNPNFIEYKSYDANIFEGHEDAIQRAVEKNKEKFNLPHEEVFENLMNQWIDGNFWNLVKETNTDKKLVVCSNYVLGVAEKNSPFWNLPGFHIHQFLNGDFERYSILGEKKENKFIFENYETMEERVKKLYGINGDAKVFGLEGYFSMESIIVYDNN